MTISVPLFAIKTKTDLGELAYKRKPMGNSQARLAGRYALEPEIALDEFVCRAVIDWITIGVWFERETQFQWVQRDVEAALGTRCFIRALDEKPGSVSDKFDIKVQEPNLRSVRQLCTELGSKYGQELLPWVRAMEISVDFRPRRPDDKSRAKLYTALTRHFWTDRDMISNPVRRPRFVHGTGRGEIGHILAYSPFRPQYVNEHHLISTGHDRSPFADSTYYVGAKHDDVRWRIMDKVVDRQNREAGTAVELDDAQKRVRVEVTLDRPEVEALGITYVDDLQRLCFSRLQKKFFTFMLPTFQGVRRGRESAIQSWKDRQRGEKFLKAGVLGLKAMDDEQERQMKKMRRRSQRRLSQLGLKLKPQPRVGDGRSGTFLAYKEMNERIGVALRHLGERVAGDFFPT